MLRCAEVLKAAQRCPVWGSGLSTSPGSLYISEGALFVTALIQTIIVCLFDCVLVWLSSLFIQVRSSVAFHKYNSSYGFNSHFILYYFTFDLSVPIRTGLELWDDSYDEIYLYWIRPTAIEVFETKLRVVFGRATMLGISIHPFNHKLATLLVMTDHINTYCLLYQRTMHVSQFRWKIYSRCIWKPLYVFMYLYHWFFFWSYQP